MPGARRGAMAGPGLPRPSAIPEHEEAPRAAPLSVRRAAADEAERAESRLQRRRSDVKVYKEFCDFYAKL